MKQKGADLGGAEFLRGTYEERRRTYGSRAGGGGTDAFEFEVLFHPIAELTHGGSPCERGK
jgi:hypothetical protein